MSLGYDMIMRKIKLMPHKINCNVHIYNQCKIIIFGNAVKRGVCHYDLKTGQIAPNKKVSY